MELTWWLEAARIIRRVYLEELGRDVLGDPEALVNWTYHMREDGRDEAWVRERVRESDEYKERHPSPPTPDPSTPAPLPPQPSPGPNAGLIVPASDTSLRPYLDPQVFLPDKGGFQFPSPYWAAASRLTNEKDGIILPSGYSYWNRINQHQNDPYLLALIGRQDGAPFIVQVDKHDLSVRPLMVVPRGGTAEQWYWSKSQGHLLYMLDGKQLLRLDAIFNSVETIYNIEWDMPGHYLWQAHSSWDDKVHSFTVRKDDTYELVGTGVFFEGASLRFKFYQVRNGYDEAQIDKSGKFLIIKEGEGDNRFIALETGGEFIVTNAQGAVGHSDMGWGYVVGEDDYAPEPGALRMWGLTPSGPTNLGVQYRAQSWSNRTLLVSHCNAKDGAWKENFIVGISTGSDREESRNGEIFKVKLDGQQQVQLVCQDLNDPSRGPAGDPYWKATKPNVCPNGEWVFWTSNHGSDRLDAFVAKLP